MPPQISEAERVTLALCGGVAFDTEALTVQAAAPAQFAKNQPRSVSDLYSVPLISAQLVRSGPEPEGARAPSPGATSAAAGWSPAPGLLDLELLEQARANARARIRATDRTSSFDFTISP